MCSLCSGWPFETIYMKTETLLWPNLHKFLPAGFQTFSISLPKSWSETSKLVRWISEVSLCLRPEHSVCLACIMHHYGSQLASIQILYKCRFRWTNTIGVGVQSLAHFSFLRLAGDKSSADDQLRLWFRPVLHPQHSLPSDSDGDVSLLPRSEVRHWSEGQDPEYASHHATELRH